MTHTYQIAVVRGDGIDDYIQGAFTTGGAMAQPFTIFVVAMLDAAFVNNGTPAVLLDDSDAVDRVIVYKYEVPNPDAWAIIAGAGAPVVGNAADSNWNSWAAVLNGATSQFWLNGISENSGNAGPNDLDGLTVLDRQPTGRPWKGDITEIILYDANLSDADKNTVGQYLATRYALAYTDI